MSAPDLVRFIFPYKNKFYEFSRPIVAKIIYKNKILDLIQDRFEKTNGFKYIKNFLSTELIQNNRHNPLVCYLYYELGVNLDLIDEESILGIILEFNSVHPYTLNTNSKEIIFDEKEVSSFEEYQASFKRGREHLSDGDCYQFNLTVPFSYSILGDNVSWENFISRVWRNEGSRGAFGSFCYFSSLKKGILSNSPECLFQIRRKGNESVIESMPIKGTIKDSERSTEHLKASIKDESELFMISDLVKNDLAKINPHRVKVIEKKAFLKVPGLLHQYSKINTHVNLEDRISWWSLVEALFPGGSITGAPKKRVIKIINDLEKRNRSAYCGSTLISFKEIKAASINIRTSEIDFDKNEFSYQAGGGITYKSDVHLEWEELHHKKDSFINLL